MNIADMIKEVAAETGLKKSDASIVVGLVFDTMARQLVEGNEVRIAGFGTFTCRERKARMGHNPRTRETIPIPAKRSAILKPAQALREAMNPVERELVRRRA
jgi:DNA-binding protein HU-beta